MLSGKEVHKLKTLRGKLAMLCPETDGLRHLLGTPCTSQEFVFSRVQMYWQIGKRIQEKEQKGKERADYGTYLLKNLAKKLEPEYGSGFSVSQLEMYR